MKRDTVATATLAERPPARLKNIHLVVLAVSLSLTFVVWNYATTLGNRQAANNFDRAADQILELTTERMKRYEDGLWAGVGALNINRGQIGMDDWRIFAQTLHIDTKYPGINGIGVIYNVPRSDLDSFVERQRAQRPDFTVKPDHDRDISLPITYIEPEDPNRQAIGLDVAFEENRYTSLIAARDTGVAQITGPITLVQDSEASSGFLFYAPVYRNGPQTDITARQETFVGVVYAPFMVQKLMAGVLDREKRHTLIEIADGNQIIYDEFHPGDPDFDLEPLFIRKVDLDMFGRVWSVTLRSDAGFRATNAHLQPTIILICGLTIDLLLLILFTWMARSSRNIVRYADNVTRELKREKADLIESNAALEQFSYVASHDLKTPIRSMRDTIDYLKEDLEEMHPQLLEDARINPSFTTLRQLLDRMEALVKGVLECAQIPKKSAPSSHLDPREAILAIGASLNLSGATLKFAGSFPDLIISSTLFSQIFSNLISNAVHHHARPKDLQITVTGQCHGADFELCVADNGPGIESRFHERIFEIFQTLETSQSPNSTGIGLAIVRKAAHAVGGNVSVVSDVGAGTAFHVHLPGVVVTSGQNMAAE